MRRQLLGVAGLSVVLLAAGCSSGQPGDLTAAAEKVLVPKVQQVREVAATGNFTHLKRVVRELETLVRRELADG